MKRHLVAKLLMLAALFALCAPLTFADTPGRHPGYLHALSDLRYARALLQMDYGDDWPAVRQVNAAIGELRNAAIDDAKPLSDHPREDANLDRWGRMNKAVALLNSAQRDISHEEDNPDARAWRNRALGHMDEARRLILAERR